jgi:hypothetical protein
VVDSKPASDRLGLAYHLVPWESIRRVSRVCLEGLEKYPKGTINARNMNPAVHDLAWQTERLNHAMDHLAQWMQGDRTEDHLAKVMWFCAVMIEVETIQAKERVGTGDEQQHP